MPVRTNQNPFLSAGPSGKVVHGGKSVGGKSFGGKSVGSMSQTVANKGTISAGKRAATMGKNVANILHPMARKMLASKKNVPTSSKGKAMLPAYKKKRRKNPGMAALKEIQKEQKNTALLIKKRPFQRFVREIANDQVSSSYAPEGIRWRLDAIEALQEATEAYGVSLFEDSMLEGIHAGRVTLMVKDMLIARRVRGEIC
jgi:histone H3/H4